jgi:NADH-quinone oxidoreductase subunit M
VVKYSPLIGSLVVVATMLNGIAVMRAYFRIFTGTRHATSIPMRSLFEEQVAIIGLSLLIVVGGIYPQPGVASRYRAAVHLLEDLHRLPAEGSVHAQ